MRKFILSVLVVILIINLSFNTLGSTENNTLQNEKLTEIGKEIVSNNLIKYKLPKLILLMQTIQNLLNRSDFRDFSFEPVDISVNDDAYHGSNSLNNVEWWYFDTILSNGYSTQLSINVFNIFSSNFVTVNFNLYKNGESIERHRSFYSIANTYLSPYTPMILINNQLIMLGQYNNKTNNMNYEIHYETNNVKIDLEFLGLTKGWKGETPTGRWAVVLPKAKVEGTLKIDQKNILVSGLGYHDHNWDVTVASGLNYGWMWGKTTTQNYTIIWSEIMTTWYKGSPLLVVNQDHEGYYNIPANSLEIRITERRIKDGFLIPYGFLINGETNNISINADIKIVDTDYQSVMGIINYWRYHVSVYGTITVNGHSETIIDDNIAEYIRFRFY